MNKKQQKPNKFTNEDLKTMQKHIENKTLLNEQLIKAGKIF